MSYNANNDIINSIKTGFLSLKEETFKKKDFKMLRQRDSAVVDSESDILSRKSVEN